MDFAAGFDGRGAAKSFQPSDTASFAHTSALNPGKNEHIHEPGRPQLMDRCHSYHFGIHV